MSLQTHLLCVIFRGGGVERVGMEGTERHITTTKLQSIKGNFPPESTSFPTFSIHWSARSAEKGNRGCICCQIKSGCQNVVLTACLSAVCLCRSEAEALLSIWRGIPMSPVGGLFALVIAFPEAILMNLNS